MDEKGRIWREIDNVKIANLYDEEGIKHEFIPAITLQQNGVAEFIITFIQRLKVKLMKEYNNSYKYARSINQMLGINFIWSSCSHVDLYIKPTPREK